MEKEFTVEKDIAEVFKLRVGYEWANITIRHNDPKGFGEIGIISSYGSWGNSWGAAGENFKDFLCRIDIHYFAGKIGTSKWFDIDKTIGMYKTLIRENREIGQITTEQESDALESLEYLNDCATAQEFCAMVFADDSLSCLYDGSPDYCTDIEPQFRHFWDTLWVPFRKYLSENK